MPPNLCPPERAIGISRQERDGLRKISLAPQEDLEGRLLRRNDGPSFAVVADALTTGEPRLSRRGRARVVGRVGNCANKIQHIRSPVGQRAIERFRKSSADDKRALLLDCRASGGLDVTVTSDPRRGSGLCFQAPSC